MELQRLVQEYVNLLCIYHFCVKHLGNEKESLNNISFLEQEKNYAYNIFINQVFQSNQNDLNELNEFLGIKLNSIKQNIYNLVREKTIFCNELSSLQNINLDKLAVLNNNIEYFVLQKEKYENINYAVKNILDSQKKKKYTKEV